MARAAPLLRDPPQVPGRSPTRHTFAQASCATRRGRRAASDLLPPTRSSVRRICCFSSIASVRSRPARCCRPPGRVFLRTGGRCMQQAITENQGALHVIAQLAHIPRPVIGFQTCNDIGGQQRQGLNTQLRRKQRHEMAGKIRMSILRARSRGS